MCTVTPLTSFSLHSNADGTCQMCTIISISQIGTLRSGLHDLTLRHSQGAAQTQALYSSVFTCLPGLRIHIDSSEQGLAWLNNLEKPWILYLPPL